MAEPVAEVAEVKADDKDARVEEAKLDVSNGTYNDSYQRDGVVVTGSGHTAAGTEFTFAGTVGKGWVCSFDGVETTGSEMPEEFEAIRALVYDVTGKPT